MIQFYQQGDYITISKAAILWNVPEQAIYKAIRDGKFLPSQFIPVGRWSVTLGGMINVFGQLPTK